MAALVVETTTDFRPDPEEIGITDLIFADPDYDSVTATFAPTQFGYGLISNTLHITGGQAADHIRIIAAAGVRITFSAEDWTFTDWGANDRITIYAPNTVGHYLQVNGIIGSSVNDAIHGGEARDFINGGEGNDSLIGGNNSDSLDGGVGADTLVGGEGDDTYFLDSPDDVVIEEGDSASDEIRATVSFSLQDHANIENLTLSGGDGLTGTGTDAQNYLLSFDSVTFYGLGGNDRLSGREGSTLDGGDGDDRLEGGEGSTLIGGNGHDKLLGDEGSTLIGGDGNDAYGELGTASARGRTIVEEAGAAGGIDHVYANAVHDTYVLPDNVEVLTLWGDGTGIGNASDNIFRTAGQRASLPALTFHGGDGNDTYYLTYRAMVIVEEAGAAAGTADQVITNKRVVTLADHVENLQFYGTIHVTGTGNASDNRIELYVSGNNQVDAGLGNDTVLAGTGTDTLIGGGGNDSLDAGLGAVADRLDGGAGVDTMIGGNGNDWYYVDDVADQVVELEDQGSDQVFSSVSFLLASPFLEHLTLTGTGDIRGEGNDFANVILGNSGANLLKGWRGSDSIQGGSGADTIRGGDGNDTLSGGPDGDSLLGESGDDSLSGGASDDTLNGSDGNDALVGDDGSDRLLGGAGNDQLNGGTGSDSLIGGAGDDQYTVTQGDTITEEVGGGYDIVVSYENVNGTTFANVERVELIGPGAFNATGGTQNDNFVGNGNNNKLSGGGGNDSLSGGANDDTLAGDAGNDTIDGGSGNDTLTGGSGIDTMNGYAGNDTYVDAVLTGPNADIVIEASGGGVDTLETSQTASLAGFYIENLILKGSAVNGTGNAFANVIMGNRNSNVLDGADGNDTISGLAGHDTIIGGGGSDVIDGGIGLDTISGQGGDDTISGGEGNDTMNGGGGRDTFRFLEANSGADRIDAFDEAVDRFVLMGGSFTGMSEANGNTTLLHEGGSILIAGVTGYSIIEWNALVEDEGAGASNAATTLGALHAAQADWFYA